VTGHPLTAQNERMRAIWKGSLSFGLVNVPVKLYSATEDHDLALHQVHDADGGRIRYQRTCELDGKVVPYEHIAKAYDDGDRRVILTDDDFAALPEERSREIEVVEFVPSEQVDPIMFERSYYLSPDSKSTKAYVLLRRTLEESDRTAIVQFALRQRTRLAALRVRDDVLVLQTLLWDDEVREARFPELDEAPKISPAELKMSKQLIESFESDFSPEKFTDDYQVQLRKLIDAKLEQGDAIDAEETFGREEESGGEVLDLMEALRRSVERQRGDKPTAARKPAAKKPAASSAKSKTSSAKTTSKATDKSAAKPARTTAKKSGRAKTA
jgi:DNA end-binding protein Ku